MFSENHFHRVWTLRAHRRLKNIAMVLEWIPDAAELKTVPASELGIMFDCPERRQKLKRSFELFDAKRKGFLDPAEFRRLATLIDPTLSPAAAEALRKQTASDDPDKARPPLSSPQRRAAPGSRAHPSALCAGDVSGPGPDGHLAGLQQGAPPVLLRGALARGG